MINISGDSFFAASPIKDVQLTFEVPSLLAEEASPLQLKNECHVLPRKAILEGGICLMYLYLINASKEGPLTT